MKRLAAGSSALVVAAVLVLAAGGASGHGGSFDPLKAAALGKLKAPQLVVKTKSGHTFVKTLPFISNGTIDAAQQALGVGFARERQEGADANGDIPDSQFSVLGGARHTLGCARRNSDGNVRVNQDCSFRRQAEEDITYNPVDPSDIVAGQNDSRVGFNQCGIDFSNDNGHNWGDMLPPFDCMISNWPAKPASCSRSSRSWRYLLTLGPT